MKTAKVRKGKVSEIYLMLLCEAFRSNNIYGPSLSLLDDMDWRHLIPIVRVRIKVQKATARKIKEDEIELKLVLISKGRPAKKVEELS